MKLLLSHFRDCNKIKASAKIFSRLTRSLAPIVATNVVWFANRGPLMDDGILTGTGITEWDKTNGVLLSGSGVARKPGATTAYRNTEAKVALTLSDGKVVGSSGSGRGVFTMATGTAAALGAKTYTYTFKSVGPGQTVIDVKID
jgi:hypothetical protein